MWFNGYFNVFYFIEFGEHKTYAGTGRRGKHKIELRFVYTLRYIY